MGNFKLRLSDIFRYIVLGAIQASLCIMVLTENKKDIFDNIPKPILDILNEPGVTLVVVLSLFYLSGYFTQLFIKIFCNGNLMGTGLAETALFINKFHHKISKYFHKFLTNDRYAHWIYYSRHPDKVVNIYNEIMETSADADIKTNLLYASNLFQGIALSLFIFSFILLYTANASGTTLVVYILITLIICVTGHYSTKSKYILIINNSLLILVPYLIVVLFYFNSKSTTGLIIAAGIFLSLCIARQLILLNIRRIDTLIKYDNDGKNEEYFIRNIKRNGIPTAFILTRVDDTAFEYIEEQLCSIREQIYPSIKVITLIDRNSRQYNNILSFIEKFRKENRLDISCYTSKGSGASKLAYEIREIFLGYADKDDVAITLDADDMFAEKNVVTRIMGRMARTNANICLITFECFGDLLLNNAKNYPNKIVERIAKESTERGIALTPNMLLKKYDAHIISTIGWTKCYKPDVLSRYLSLWRTHQDELENNPKYEDFPDIIALLDKDSRICAVRRTSIMFRKRPNSVTTSVSIDSYNKYIPYFFKMAIDLSKDNDSISDEAKELIRKKFIPYKFVQYLNIVRKKTTAEKPSDEPELKNYSANDFYQKFVKEVCNNSEDELRKGMIEILNDNYRHTNSIKNSKGSREPKHSYFKGYYGDDLPNELEKETISFEDIIKAYGLNITNQSDNEVNMPLQ